MVVITQTLRWVSRRGEGMSVRAPQRPYPTKQHLQHVLGASCLPNARAALAAALRCRSVHHTAQQSVIFVLHPCWRTAGGLRGNPVATGVVCDGRHVFHKFCLRQWVQTNRSDCPDCRRAMYPSVIEQLGGLPDESADDWSAEDEQLPTSWRGPWRSTATARG